MQRIDAALKSLRDDPMALRKETTSLLVTATSGFQVSQSYNIVSPKGFNISQTTRAALSQCSGPHVGSFKNKIFKQYLYGTGIPAVLFVDASKVDCEIHPEHCHFVFDGEMSWERFLRERPLALCVGSPTEEFQQLREQFARTFTNFTQRATSETRPFSAFLATNELFRKAFPE